MAVRRIDLLQGTLDLLILKTLGTGPNHGYGIASRIHLLSEDMLRVEEGSLYEDRRIDIYDELRRYSAA